MGSMMQFKKGGGCGYYHLYEIAKETFDALADGMRDDKTYRLIGSGRHLYMAGGVDRRGSRTLCV